MKKAKDVFCVFGIVFFFALFGADTALGEYKITANIIDMQEICFITGEVRDASGNPVHPAEITFACGEVQTKVSTIPGGYYINTAPLCSNYTITATAPGEAPKSISGLSVVDGQLLPLDFTFDSEASLEGVIGTLRILSGLETVDIPADHNQDNRVGLEDAIYNLEVVAGLRDSASAQSVGTRRTAFSSSQKNVKVWNDSNGDGVDELIQTVVTDTYGYIEIDGLSEGNYTLTAASVDNTSAVRVENIKIAGRSVHLKTIRTKPVGWISGNVQLERATDHNGIHVYIPGTSYGATTASNGNFTILNVAEGTYNIRAEMANFGSITMNDIPVESGQDSGLDTFILPSVVGTVNGSMWLQGATDYTGILVILRKDIGTTYVTTTDPSGTYAFADIPVGDYTLEASMAGYVAQQQSVTIQSGTNQPSSMLLVLNNNKGTLTGTVTLDNFSDYSGILVSLAGTGYMAVTDPTGTYTVSDIPEAAYTVFVKADGYGAKRFENVQINSGQVTQLDGSLTAQSSITGSEAGGSIVGMAGYLDQSDYSGISVKLEGTDIPLVGTDTNGGFIINNVTPGTYTLLFTQANHKTVRRTGIVISPWDATFVRPVMMIPPKGDITGTVQLEGESSHDNVIVSVDGTSISAQSLADGSFLLEEVDEGTVSITAYKAGFETARVTGIKVLPGHTVILEETILLSKPPVPPTGITASQASGSSVNVGWTASVSTDVIGYNVYYGTSSDLIDQKANTELVTPLQLEVTGLNKGVTYYFAVKAVDNDGLISILSQYVSIEIVPQEPNSSTSLIINPLTFQNPEDICISRDGLRAYVTNRLLNGVVSLVDRSIETVLDNIIVGQGPSDLAANPVKDEVYCLNYNSDTVSVIDSIQTDVTQAVIATISVPGMPVRCQVSPDGKYLFVSCTYATVESIRVIDLDTRLEIIDSPIQVGMDPLGMAIANNKLYVANESSNTVSVIDLDPNSETRWKAIGNQIQVGSNPVDTVSSSDGRYIYVANSGSDNVSVIDTTTNNVIKELSVGSNPIRMAVSGNMLYVTNNFSSNVSMINTETNQVLNTLIDVGQYPVGIAVTADGETIYIVNNLSQSVSIRIY